MLQHSTFASGAFALAMVLVSAFAVAGETPSTEATEAQLKEVRSRIEALSSRLGHARSAQTGLETQLRESELDIGFAARELKVIQSRLVAKGRRLDALEKRRREQEAHLAGQRLELAKHIRSAYALGRRDYLKILLNQEDPATVSRILTYNGYFNRARARQIETVTAQLALMRKTRDEIKLETSALERLSAEKTAWKARLESERAKRAAVLDKLRAEIAAGDLKMTRLQEDEVRLEALLDELQHLLADIPAALDAQEPFAELRGRLSWPTGGTVIHAFGTRRKPGNLNWQGVWLAGNEGEPVHAVYRGRVAFADWLRGFGLLLIVDHGDGYMSLYGHGHSLYKETGDWVGTGEVVASVGNSGGHTETGLYFEIRHRGTPLNPTTWCERGSSSSGTALVSP